MQHTWDASLYAGHGRFVALHAERLLEALDPRPGERILDLGCGDGFLTRRIADSGATVVGIDSSPHMVAAAKEHGADARWVDADSLPQERRAGAIEEMVTLLKPALCDREGHWMADYVRLRFLARRP